MIASLSFITGLLGLTSLHNLWQMFSLFQWLNAFAFLNVYIPDEILYLVQDWKESSGYLQFLICTRFDFEKKEVFGSNLGFEQSYSGLSRYGFYGSIVLNLWQVWKFYVFIFIIWWIAIPCAIVFWKCLPKVHWRCFTFVFFGVWIRMFLIRYLYTMILALTDIYY